jgi:hypothetical protein
VSCHPVLEYRSAIDRTRGAQRGDEDLDHVAAPSRSRPHGSIVRIEPAIGLVRDAPWSHTTRGPAGSAPAALEPE